MVLEHIEKFADVIEVTSDVVRDYKAAMSGGVKKPTHGISNC